MLKILGLKCPKCKTIIYSRAVHDFRWYPCQEIAVDGGFDYLKGTYKSAIPKSVEFSLDITKEDLYNDWNKRINKFGILEPEAQIMTIIELKD